MLAWWGVANVLCCEDSTCAPSSDLDAHNYTCEAVNSNM